MAATRSYLKLLAAKENRSLPIRAGHLIHVAAKALNHETLKKSTIFYRM